MFSIKLSSFCRICLIKSLFIKIIRKIDSKMSKLWKWMRILRIILRNDKSFDKLKNRIIIIKQVKFIYIYKLFI